LRRAAFGTPVASRNLMLAHGAAVKRYRGVGAHRIGLVVNIEPKYPASNGLTVEDNARAGPGRHLLEG
jgi:beta-glucosidase